MNTDLRSYAHNYTSLRYSQGSNVLWYYTHFCNFLIAYTNSVYSPGNQTIKFLLFIWYQNLDYFEKERNMQCLLKFKPTPQTLPPHSVNQHPTNTATQKHLV